jgi:YgiT-type zinc finger domain-containing protein
MFHCHICGSHEARQEVVSEVFEIEGDPVLVENIPGEVCIRCRKAVFSRETTERVRRMVHGEAKPVKSVQMDVFAYS